MVKQRRTSNRRTTYVVIFILCSWVFLLVIYLLNSSAKRYLALPEVFSTTKSKDSEKLTTTSTFNNIEWPPVINEVPTDGSYPVYSPLLDIIKNWSPDNPDLPKYFKETLIHFNYSNPLELSYAQKFRDAEVPFKLYGIPEFSNIENLWTDDYLRDHLANEDTHVEKSKTNHFM